MRVSGKRRKFLPQDSGAVSCLLPADFAVKWGSMQTRRGGESHGTAADPGEHSRYDRPGGRPPDQAGQRGRGPAVPAPAAPGEPGGAALAGGAEARRPEAAPGPGTGLPLPHRRPGGAGGAPGGPAPGVCPGGYQRRPGGPELRLPRPGRRGGAAAGQEAHRQRPEGALYLI